MYPISRSRLLWPQKYHESKHEMAALQTKRIIDSISDAVSCAIAHGELERAQKLYTGHLCDLVECQSIFWNDDLAAYWQKAVDQAAIWLADAQQIEGEIAEYLHFEQTPHRPQGLHHENVMDALAKVTIYTAGDKIEYSDAEIENFRLDFNDLSEIPFEAGGSATRMIEPDDGMYGDEFFDNLFDTQEQILHRGELELGL